MQSTDGGTFEWLHRSAGGLRAFEEFLEAVMCAQLGLHHKPCGLLTVCRYYDGLMRFLDHAVTERLLRAEHRNLVLMDESPQNLSSRFATYRMSEVEIRAVINGNYSGADSTKPAY